jgi:hypothetical protein
MSIDKIKNISFYGGFNNFFKQVFLHPILTICLAILISMLRLNFGWDSIVCIIIFFIFWNTIGHLIPNNRPLYIFLGHNITTKTTKLSVGYEKHKVSGILQDIIDSANSIIFVVQEKIGEKKIELPLTVLPEGLLPLFKDSILNIDNTDYKMLRDKLLSFNYKAKIIEGETFHNLHAKKYSGILLTQYIAKFGSLIFAYLLVFHIIV